MLNKNVCPKCGQLYDLSLAACPVCNTPAQVPAEPEPAVQRRRLTEVERRQRQQEQKHAAAEARRREREERRAADAEEERLLEEEEERLWRERQKKKLEKRGLTEEEITQKLDAENEQPTRVRRKKTATEDGHDPARTPAIFPLVSIVLLLLALAVGGSYLLWSNGILELPFYEQLTTGASAPAETGAACTGLSLSEEQIELTAAGQTHALSYTRLPESCTEPVTFQTSDERVVMVGELGIITAVAPGSATITATCGTVSASCTVTCSFEAAETEPPETIDPSEGITLSETDITFREAGENTYLSVTNLPAGATVFWASSNESVATVEENGHVVAVGRGTCYITAVVDDYTESCIVRCNFED